ncbi:MAG: universal stress protein [Candidatus Bathyarchaeota archaeon]|nr:universal stress protein [Candidatus Bathyarchaeota archaeon]
MYDRILVAIDGSEPSLKALEQAVELALLLGSEIAIVSVVSEMRLPFSAEYGLWAMESHEELRRKVLESLNSAILKIKTDHPELKADARMEEGRPAKRITELAENEGFDLIVIGRRGAGLVDRLIMGSVSSEVVRISTKPVLVVE